MILRNFGILLIALSAVSPAAAAKKKVEVGAYKGAITIDAHTGQVLFEDNADLVSPPASVTKLMTFFVVADRIKSGALALDSTVQITAEDAKLGGTQVWLDPRETIKVDDLLYAMMIRSANDAANALARAAGGSREAFVEMMNAKAKELGMTHTTFRSPHGLPPSSRKLSESDLTSPRDLALLSRALVEQTEVLKYTSVKRRAFREESSQQVMMDSHNHLLGKVTGCDGLKTGFTGPAGYCISATAERNGRRVIVVVMGSPSYQSRDVKAIELIENGFKALPASAPATTGPISPISPVSSGAKSSSSAQRTPISAAPAAAASTSQSSASAASSSEKQEPPPPTVTFPTPKKR